jgi:hypothetical protein
MVSEHQSARSQPYISVRKYYSAPPCSIPAHLPLDVPEQCCGLSLSTLTLRESTDGHPPDNRRSTSQSIANSPISIACSAPPTRFWPASSASPVARSRTGSPPSPAPRWKSGQKGQKPPVQVRWHCLHRMSVAAVRKGPVAGDGNFRSRQWHAKIPFVACRADRARTLRRKQAPCARLRPLIGISLAEIAEIPWASRRRRLESHGRITNCATEGTRQGWLPWPRLPVYRPPGKRGPSRASTSWMSGQGSSIASATRR